jgi:hypothetical protein
MEQGAGRSMLYAPCCMRSARNVIFVVDLGDRPPGVAGMIQACDAARVEMKRAILVEVNSRDPAKKA